MIFKHAAYHLANALSRAAATLERWSQSLLTASLSRGDGACSRCGIAVVNDDLCGPCDMAYHAEQAAICRDELEIALANKLPVCIVCQHEVYNIDDLGWCCSCAARQDQLEAGWS